MRCLLWMILGLLVAATLAGCLQRTGDAQDAAPSAPSWTATSHYGIKPYPIEVHDRIAPQSEKTWVFEWRNDAPGDNPVEYNAACAGPFQVTVLGPDGQERQPEEPQAACQALEMKTLDAGDALTFSWNWDGTLWSDGGSAPAPQGTYTIQIGFEGYHNGNREHITDEAVGETQVTVTN